MLSIEQIHLILRLLTVGELTQHKIAEVAGVSRSSVYNISRGQLGLKRPRRSKPLIKPIRCPRCGGLVAGPCLLCRARTHCQLSQIDAPGPNNPNPRRAA